jgi:hypothetical protein
LGGEGASSWRATDVLARVFVSCKPFKVRWEKVSITRLGSSRKYSEGWDAAFSKKRKPPQKPSVAKKALHKNSARKRARKKASAK